MPRQLMDLTLIPALHTLEVDSRQCPVLVPSPPLDQIVTADKSRFLRLRRYHKQLLPPGRPLTTELMLITSNNHSTMGPDHTLWSQRKTRSLNPMRTAIPMPFSGMIRVVPQIQGGQYRPGLLSEVQARQGLQVSREADHLKAQLGNRECLFPHRLPALRRFQDRRV